MYKLYNGDCLEIMDRLIEEAEESIRTEGTITLEELKEELIREYNVNI